MAHKPIRLLLTFMVITVMTSAFLPSRNVRALAGPVDGPELPSLEVFVEQVSNGQAGELRGAYVPGLLAASIVQQPSGMNGFVSPRQNVLTQFGMASRQGTTGLLAHNDLAGKAFTFLQAGQKIYLIDGSGKISTFTVKEILRYQALEPDSISSTFVDLDTFFIISTPALFKKVYNRPGQLVFQTCIQAENNPTWGRLFVIAQPSD